MAITLSIAGTDRSSIVFRNSISVQMRSNGQQWTASFTLRVLEGTYRPLVGQAVAIEENGVARFLGTIDEVTEDRMIGGDGNSQVWLRCLCTDLSARLGQRFASTPKTYKDQTAGAILLDVLGTHGTGEGITFAASTSGGRVFSGADVTKYVVDHQSVAQIADDLARLSGFVWGVSPTGVLYFHARTAQNAAWSINYSTLNYTRISSRKTREDYYNESWTRISWEAFAPTVETFHGSGSTRTWNLAHEAARVESITLNGTDVEWGGEGEGRKYTWYYGETGITQDSGETLLTGTDDLVVTYRELGTDWIYVHDDYAIGERAAVEGNSGHYGKTLEETDQSNATAADEKATAALTTAAVIPVVVTIETLGSYFQPSPGEVATISTDAPILSGTYLVQEISAQQEGEWFRYTITALNGTRIGNWIDYFRALADKGVSNPAASGSATTTGGTDAPPGNVTLGTPQHQVSTDGSTLTITQPYTPPGPLGSFAGVWCQVEAPDQSTTPAAKLDGSHNLGTHQLAGAPRPRVFGPFAYNALDPAPVSVEIPCPTEAMTIRVRLISYSTEATNDAALSPSTTFAFTPETNPDKPGSGTPYADNVEGFAVPAPLVQVVGGVSMTSISPTFTRPSSARPWDGVYVCCEYTTADGDVTTDKGVIWASGMRSNYFPTPPVQTAKVYALSYRIIDDVDMVNPYVPGVTPEVTVSLGNAEGPTGTEYADDVTGLSAVPTDVNDGGKRYTEVATTFTKPTDSRWQGVMIGITYTTDDGDTTTNWGDVWASTGVDGITYSNRFPTPNTVQTVTLEARSYTYIDGVKQVNTSGPTVSITIGTTGGTLDLGKAITDSVGSALAIVTGVLGVASGGITESLLNDFAVSQQKLANAPIIDTARIVDAAITTAKIQNLAITNALIANAAITNAKIGDLQVTSAKIASLEAGKVTAGTLQSGVVYAGTINASQIVAGTVSVASTGAFLNVKYSGDNRQTQMYPNGFAVLNASLVTIVQIDNSAIDGFGRPSGYMALSNGGGTLNIVLNAATGNIYASSLTAGNGASGTISYLKPGGSTGTISVSGGIITGWT